MTSHNQIEIKLTKLQVEIRDQQEYSNSLTLRMIPCSDKDNQRLQFK